MVKRLLIWLTDNWLWLIVAIFKFFVKYSLKFIIHKKKKIWYKKILKIHVKKVGYKKSYDDLVKLADFTNNFDNGNNKLVLNTYFSYYQWCIYYIMHFIFHYSIKGFKAIYYYKIIINRIIKKKYTNNMKIYFFQMIQDLCKIVNSSLNII